MIRFSGILVLFYKPARKVGTRDVSFIKVPAWSFYVRSHLVPNFHPVIGAHEKGNIRRGFFCAFSRSKIFMLQLIMKKTNQKITRRIGISKSIKHKVVEAGDRGSKDSMCQPIRKFSWLFRAEIYHMIIWNLCHKILFVLYHYICLHYLSLYLSTVNQSV